MNNLAESLSQIQIDLEDLLLDPNNPRFSELGEELSQVPEGRFADEKVQQATFDKMKTPSFDVSELRDTIKTNGFLPMDRIVVREWKGGGAAEKKYVVIEGNRRVTALKWLKNLHEIGKETFDEIKLNNYTKLECLLLDDSIAPSTASLILPGLRHVSGIKEWGAYQKAKAIHALRKSGMSPQEAAQSLGLSTRAANHSYRCFLALEQMSSNDEFGEYAAPKMYSYFDEVIKRQNLKNWLDWNDDQERFLSDDHLKEFYSWMVPSDDGSNTAKLPESKSVRDLSKIIDDESALSVFRAPEGSLSRALARYEIDHPEDWYPKIQSANAALKSLTPEVLRQMDESTLKGLIELRDRIEQTIKDREILLAGA